MRKTLGATALLVLVLLAGGALRADDAAGAAAGRWWADVSVLAADSMQGRNTGSPEYQRAAEYVASEFQAAGIRPAGVQGFMQPVRFRTRRILEDRSSLALVRGATAEPLALGEDATLNMRIDPAPSVEAGLVFVGYGLRVPEYRVDDFTGQDLHGNVAVYLTGGPSTVPGALRAHYQSAGERWAALRSAGAIGAIAIPNPKSMDVPWARSSPSRLLPAMTLADTALDDTAGERFAATFNPAHADKLLAGSGHTFAEILALADAGKPLPRFPLPARLRATVHAETGAVEAPNVVGVLPAARPERRNEYVVVSAHLDHVGVGAPIKGDRIYNGAMDNASGVAALLEIARELKSQRNGPARSVLFVVVAGEEKGLLGSRYFVAHPTVARSGIVADVNIDMFLPLFPMKEVMVLGLDESNLGADIRAAAAQQHVGVQNDPEPQRNRFIRSDQYNFIRAGIPSLAMKVGYEEGTPEAGIARRWIAERYHAPSDDLNQPIDRGAAAAYIALVRDLVTRIAARPDKPAWNEASFFRRFAAK
ncbi:MAG: M28 family metallopeptidase [Betaproteobacteria bacterium]